MPVTVPTPPDMETDFITGGFAAHLRRKREMTGDFRSGSEILAEEQRVEEDARNIALWGPERGAEINQWQRHCSTEMP
jgi:hypothetical protein